MVTRHGVLVSVISHFLLPLTGCFGIDEPRCTSRRTINAEMSLLNFFPMVVTFNVLPGVALLAIDSVSIIVIVSTNAFYGVFFFLNDCQVQITNGIPIIGSLCGWTGQSRITHDLAGSLRAILEVVEYTRRFLLRFMFRRHGNNFSTIGQQGIGITS